MDKYTACAFTARTKSTSNRVLMSSKDSSESRAKIWAAPSSLTVRENEGFATVTVWLGNWQSQDPSAQGSLNSVGR